MRAKDRGTHHDGKVIIVDAVVVDGGLEEVRVFREPEPGLARDGNPQTQPCCASHRPTYHLGRFTGEGSILAWDFIEEGGRGAGV